MITPISYNYSNPTFNANLKSPKLQFSQKDFFIKIRGYGRNISWANQVKKTADAAVYMIRKKDEPEDVLKLVTKGVTAANRYPLDLEKRLKTGILRTFREGWECGRDREIGTPYSIGRYKLYADRLDKVHETPLKCKDEKLGMSKPEKYRQIHHGEAKDINYSLNYIFSLYKDKFSKYISKTADPEDLNDINDIIAEIRWVMAHATPWLRGSDAISNVFMRALYKSVGVKAYPPAKGVSFDLEAYCTNLDDYKRNFPSYFEKPPVVIE